MFINLLAGKIETRPLSEEVYYTKPEVMEELGHFAPGPFDPALHDKKHVHVGIESIAEEVKIHGGVDILLRMQKGETFKVNARVRRGVLFIEEVKE